MKQASHYRPPENEMLDPDVRFLLANERTLLAWVRTGIALQAGGLALAHISDEDSARLIGVIIVLLGVATALIGYSRYRSADRAIRSARLPLPGLGPVIEVGLIVLIGIIIVVAHFTGTW
jgi:putative membrane protein